MRPYPIRNPIPIIRQWWYRLWIREDEFDISLSLDVEYLCDINRKIGYYIQFWDAKDKLDYWKSKYDWYLNDLGLRRVIAHRRDMNVGEH